jgi:AraC-like DNA-binding protein
MPKSLTRSAILTGYADLAREVGLDPLKMVASIGLPASCLADADLPINEKAARRLLEGSARQSGVQDFGLRLARIREMSNLGSVGLMARHQPTLGAGLRILIDNSWAYNPAMVCEIEEDEGFANFRIAFRGDDRPDASPQTLQLMIGVLARTIQAIHGSWWRPAAVLFAHAAPPDATLYRRVFGVTPRFDQECNAIVISDADLSAPLKGADPLAAAQLQRYIDQVEGRQRSDLLSLTEDVIAALLPKGHCTAERVHAHMGVDRRTLNRWLGSAGLSFKEVRGRARLRLAAAHVAEGWRPLTEVARLLGFSSLSAFSHWHHREYGVSPMQARKTSQRSAARHP